MTLVSCQNCLGSIFSEILVGVSTMAAISPSNANLDSVLY